MTLPTFLIIGAMKSGTTTLYRDLGAHPGVFFPIDKEPGTLAEDPTPKAWHAYEKLFDKARADQVAGEASTAYTKRPTHEGVAARACELLGPDLRVIYIVRDPIERIISHHYHAHSWGDAPADIDRAVREMPELIDYSRYAYQIEPWLEAFDRERLRVVRLEEYSADRASGCAGVLEFLGLDPSGVDTDTSEVHNRGEQRPFHTGWLSGAVQSPLYRRLVRPVLPVGLKDQLRRRLEPKAPARPAPPRAETTQWLRERLRTDMDAWRDLFGPSASAWDGH